jgi:hypothetical protein
MSGDVVIKPDELARFGAELDGRAGEIRRMAPHLNLPWDALGEFDEARDLMLALNTQITEVSLRLQATGNVLSLLATVAKLAASMHDANEAEIQKTMKSIETVFTAAQSQLDTERAVLAAQNKLESDEVTSTIVIELVNPILDGLGLVPQK